ncbi:MAG TPA: YgjP-like metallopeptidase domain-containing protein, partial [Roseimicrobium sp.]|nr:YgjP-like metallopeptidase domain-containing protein [Roseimicrobium sp.]
MSPNLTSNQPRGLTLARSGLPVEVRQHPRARRYRLAVRPDGSIRLTLPKSGSLKEGVDFLSRQETWIESARARVLARKRPDESGWSDGSPVWFRGQEHTLKTGVLAGMTHVALADQSIRVHPPVPSNLRTTVESHLRKLAIQEFPELVTRLA